MANVVGVEGDILQQETSKPTTALPTFDVFRLRDQLVGDYSRYLRSFLSIGDQRILELVSEVLESGHLWPEPLIQMNPAFEPGGYVNELVAEGLLHPKCRDIFAIKEPNGQVVRPMRLHRHQVDAIRVARQRESYVLTTGTGSGKSLSYIVPIVDDVLRRGGGKGKISAIIIYPMNALANSQMNELERFLKWGFDGKGSPVTFGRFTGQENQEARDLLRSNPPDILLTNYVMMELLLTRPYDHKIVEAASALRFLVLDELHTYRGRQGADVAMLVRRICQRCGAADTICVGTSATLASEGNQEARTRVVADFATRMFGLTVKPESIIGETLSRVTEDNVDRERLRRRLQNPPQRGLSISFQDFCSDPLSAWMESKFGLTREEGRLVRARPITINGASGASHQLAEETGLSQELCRRAIEEAFLEAYRADPHPETNSPPFAFKLHQFFSKGDTIYASLESPEKRYLTLQGQQFVPGDRSKLLFPLCFCRECGQEYYSVFGRLEGKSVCQVEPRRFQDRMGEEGTEPGYLYLNPRNPWPLDSDKISDRLPEDWQEEGRQGLKLRSSLKYLMPKSLRVTGDGKVSPGALEFHYVQSPFRFCMNCGVTYDSSMRSDVPKLTTLDMSGRSTATTLLSVAVHRSFVESDGGLPVEARKLLAFTDNRQDASLQAGHFNDFVQVGWLRSALYRAALSAGAQGLAHEDLTHKVFAALNLAPDMYCLNPEAQFLAKQQNEQALREVLGYRLYRDLMRGWRVSFPNLEQCGLLEISYISLAEVTQAREVWEELHPALRQCSPDKRYTVLKTLLDFLRRELVIRVSYLEAPQQEKIKQLSNQRLREPWDIDEDEVLETSKVAFPCGKPPANARGITVSGRGGFGRYLRRKSILGGLSLVETDKVILDLFRVLQIAGLLEQVYEPKEAEGTPGYQISAAGMVWKAGTGKQPFYDPIRIPRLPDTEANPNAYFLEFYREAARLSLGLEAREHTAQVPAEARLKRENLFREGKLPVMYCSPTMELGVDIKQLNVVGMRNVPPSPANYAQRSGRAGRSGQPALVFTYCTAGSPHDQYFFRRQARMVAGSVELPRIDLGNEDLVAAHVRAEWLAATEQDLKTSLKEILDLEGDHPSLSLLPSVSDNLRSPKALVKARQLTMRVLDTIAEDLRQAGWFTQEWLDQVLNQAVQDLDRACDRWRELHRAATQQIDLQVRIIKDASRSAQDRKQAQRLEREAQAQLKLLLDSDDRTDSDFYSYRYFASEGFLPGYNFPRLPLSAYIPGRRHKDEFVSRPRFLAISEFGPRSIIYHEGSRFQINRVFLPLEGGEVSCISAKRCDACGTMHVATDVDRCESCNALLPLAMESLFRMRSVVTRRRDRIHCDEEERTRMGFELQTGISYEPRSLASACCRGELQVNGQTAAKLLYAQAAQIWRMNLGEVRRKKKEEHGFFLDVEGGYWARNENEEDSSDDPTRGPTKKVIPYVQDHRNSLILEPTQTVDPPTLMSLMWALKRAIQTTYQLEDQELAAEPLPSSDTPAQMLFYEASEGGAGVLRRLLLEPGAVAAVCQIALGLCHYDPETGADRKSAGPEACEAACYDCLLSYSNQHVQKLLDRKTLPELLSSWKAGKVVSSSSELSRAEHLERLLKQCDSQLEKIWLAFLEERQLRLPSQGQLFIEKAGTRPDFVYAQPKTAIYVDGPPHDYPDRQKRDRLQEEELSDLGYRVLRFGHRELAVVSEAGKTSWASLITDNPDVFGGVPARHVVKGQNDLFDPAWHDLLARLPFDYQPGEDIEDERGVVGSSEVELSKGNRRLRLLCQGPDAEEVLRASKARGVEAWIVDPKDPTLFARLEGW